MLRDVHVPWGGRSRRSEPALVLVPLALIVVVMVVDLNAPEDVHLGPLLVAAPAITASFGSPRLVAAIGVAAVGAQTIIAGFVHGGIATLNHEVQIAALVLISAFVVVFSALRERAERQLSQVRTVAEAAQRVLLRPLPRRIGPLRVASFYLAAEAEAQIGGDLYAAARTDTATRLIIGDVRGKGLAAIGDAAGLLDAFRESAHRDITLPQLAERLEARVERGQAELGEDDHRATEGFVTAALLEVPDEPPDLRLISLGHPAPLLVAEGRVRELAAASPAPPLGLSHLTGAAPACHSGPGLRTGDILLLYTDGVIEARDAGGTFYPLADRVMSFRDTGPDRLLRFLHDDLLTYVGGRLGDDAAMVAVERLPEPRIPHHHGR